MRFSYRMVPEVYQVFWAGMAAGEFINDAAIAAGSYRKQGTRWLAAAGGVRPRRGRGLKGRCLTLPQREEIALGRANITCNKNGVPFDPEKPMITSGIRLGSPAGTTRGFGITEFQTVGNMITEVLDVMTGLAKDGMTMIVVTHEMGFARKVADRVLFMADGAIVEENTPEAFFTDPQTDRAKDFLAKVLSH